MRLHVRILALPSPSDQGLSIDAYRERIRRADSYGFARISSSDTQLDSMECFSALAFMAENTRHTEIGPMVTNPVTRDLGVMANALASLDLISGGRAYCVIGRGDSAVRNAGLKPATVAYMREHFVALRSLLDSGEAAFQGRRVRLPWAPGRRRKLPLYLVAEGPRMLRLAGEVADGVYIGHGLTADLVQEAIELVHAGARDAGRDPSTLDLWWDTRSGIATTHKLAMARAREGLASAGNHALRGDYTSKRVPPDLHEPLAAFHARFDYAQKARSTQNAPLMDELGLTSYFMDRFGVVGTPDEVVERLQQLESVGVHQISIPAHDFGVHDRTDSLQLIGEEIALRVA